MISVQLFSSCCRFFPTFFTIDTRHHLTREESILSQFSGRPSQLTSEIHGESTADSYLPTFQQGHFKQEYRFLNFFKIFHTRIPIVPYVPI